MTRALCILVSIALHALCSAGGPGSGRACKGEDPCKVCRDCSACRWCDPKNPRRGSCGTCRDQSGDEARKRDAKRGKKD